VTVSTGRVKARVDLASGNITFLDARSKVILAEKSRGIFPALFRGNPRFTFSNNGMGTRRNHFMGLGKINWD